jgi:hypothetical protein
VLNFYSRNGCWPYFAFPSAIFEQRANIVCQQAMLGGVTLGVAVRQMAIERAPPRADPQRGAGRVTG